MGEVGSVSSSNPLDTDGSDDEECEVNDMALGSSFITSGSDSSGEDNETKKPRLDQSMTESEGVEGQEVMENVSIAEVTRKEDIVSSGVAVSLPQEGSSEGEGDKE